MSNVTVYTSTLTGRSERFEAGQRQKPWPHSSDDPTATKTLRSKYAAEMYRRFRALKGAIREGIVNRNALGVNTPGPGESTPGGFAPEFRAYPIGPPDDPERFPDFETCVDAIQGDGTSESDAERICGKWQQRVEGNASFSAMQGINIDPPDPGQFDYPSDERKVQEFMEWLEEQTERGILEQGRRGRRVTANDHWQNVYLRSAYEKGVTHADAALYDAGVIAEDEMIESIFRMPQHADAAGLIYTRAYRELEGVTDEMGRQISRELADGISQGENPRKIASRINGRVDNVGLHRGRVIARTETNRAHNEASLNRYEDIQERIDGVQALVEFTTAGDSRVCVECASLESMTVDVENARGILPIHANCRCAWIPVPEGTNPTQR